MQALIQKYQSNILQRPIQTFAVQSGTIQLLGDVVAQQLIEKKGKQHDYYRTGRMFTYGFFISGPVVGTWFNFVNKTITIKNRFGAALTRTAMDQIIFSPFIIGCFMFSISVLEGRSLDQIKQKFENSYLEGLKNGYKFWPMCNLVIFSTVPYVYRPLANSACSLGWNTYLSILNQNSLNQPIKNDTHVISHPTNLASSSSSSTTTIDS